MFVRVQSMESKKRIHQAANRTCKKLDRQLLNYAWLPGTQQALLLLFFTGRSLLAGTILFLTDDPALHDPAFSTMIVFDWQADRYWQDRARSLLAVWK